MKLEIIKNDLFVEYQKSITSDLQQNFDALKDAELSKPGFSFYTSVASVFSSR